MFKRLFSILFVLLLILAIGAWIACPDHDERQSSVSGEAIINIPRAAAWAKLQDLSLAHHYVPGLINTKITTPQKIGIGASRRVYQAPDKYLNETVIAWDEGYGFTIRVHRDDGEANFPFKELWFSYRLSDHGDNQSRASTTLGYELSAGCLGYWIDKMLLGKVVQKNVHEVAHNLKLFYENKQ